VPLVQKASVSSFDPSRRVLVLKRESQLGVRRDFCIADLFAAFQQALIGVGYRSLDIGSVLHVDVIALPHVLTSATDGLRFLFFGVKGKSGQRRR
jgi:hypothetical protein